MSRNRTAWDTNTDDEALRKSFLYLAKIRGLPERKLRLHHEKCFRAPKWYQYYLPTRNVPRDFLERRLYYRYIVKYPYFKQGKKGPEYKALKKAAREVLFKEPPHTKATREERAKEDMKYRVLFTRRRIWEYPERVVEGYLEVLGFHINGDLETKRQALWSFYNSSDPELPHSDALRKEKRGFRKRKRANYEDNHYVLLDVILRFPEMGWPEFEEYFSDLMPSVTSNSFYCARNRLRREYGVPIPRLKPGRRPLQEVDVDKFLERLDNEQTAKPKSRRRRNA
jgi:hypothetical protein